MKESILLRQIGQKERDKKKLAEKVAKNSDRIPEVIEGMGAESARIKYGCAKVLRMVSEQHPAVLYPYIDFFVGLLESDKNIMKWEGIHVIGNLASVDEKSVIDGIVDKYLSPIPGPVLITAANVIRGAAKIASAKPHLAERIAKGILKVEHAKYKTAECRNVALGQAIASLDQFFEHIEDKKPVLALIKKQLRNTRASTRKKAEKFIKKIT